MNGGFKIQLQVVRVTFKFSDAIAAATPISYPITLPRATIRKRPRTQGPGKVEGSYEEGLASPLLAETRSS